MLPSIGTDAVYSYCRSTSDGELHARTFAPLDGTIEDPATGSATAATIALLASLSGEKPVEAAWRVEQGVDVGRPSLLLGRTQKRDGFVRAVHIAGRAVSFMGVLPDFGDQREIELLVEAGFAPVEAIRIATLNGALYEGKQTSIGSVEVGKNADLVVVKGDPSQRITDIENTEIVFKDGIGYDAQKLIRSVTGKYGEY
jgi:hypothetical protein